MTHFDPKKPCVRRNGTKIVQLVELVRPLPSGEVLFALDETGGYSFNHSGGRYFHTIEKENDLVNIPEKMTVQAWAVVERETGKVLRLCEPGPSPFDNVPVIAIPLTGEYER